MVRTTIIIYVIGLLLIGLFAGLLLPGCAESLAKQEAEIKVDPRIQVHPTLGVCLMKIPAGTNIGGYITKHDGFFICNGVLMQMIQDLTATKTPKQFSKQR